MKISLVEYDAGNLPSVERALARQGIETERAATPEAIRAAARPDSSRRRPFRPVDAHAAARADLLAPIREAIDRGTPLLGICLGLQALFAGERRSAGAMPGLNIFPGQVAALPATAKLPHMGWNQLASRAPLGPARRRSRRGLLLFRAFLRRPGRRRMRPWPCAITACRSSPRSNAGISLPCSFTRKNRATPERACWPISSPAPPARDAR